MRILVRVVVIILFVFVLAIGGIGAYLALLFDPNDYRQEIVERAKNAAGVDLKINGEIGWSIYPWLALDINDVQVSYVNQPQLATLGKASAALNLPALLGGTVQIDSVQIIDLQLNLEKNETGAVNWVAATSNTTDEGTADQTADAASDSPVSDSGSQAASSMALAVEQISLQNAAINYSDAQTGQSISITEVNLQADQVALGTAFPLNFTGALAQANQGQQSLNLDLDLSTQLLVDQTVQRIELQGLDLEGTLTLADLAEALRITQSANVLIDLAQEQVRISDLRSSVSELSLQGSLDLTGFSVPAISGQISVPAFNPRVLASQLGVELPELGEGALESISLSTQLTGDSETIRFSDLSLALDQTQFTGSASYALSNGMLGLNLAGNQINLDNYLPPADPSAETTSGSSGAASSGGGTSSAQGWSKEVLFDLTGLRALNAAIEFSLQKALYQGLEIANLKLGLTAQDGLVQINQLNANGFDGTLSATARIDARAEQPQFAIDPTLSNVAIGQLLALAMEEPMAEGKINLSGALTTSGNSLYLLINGLNGTLNLNAAEGQIQGIDVAQELCQNIENLTSLGINPDQVDRSTPIADLNSNFNIVKGVVTNPDLGLSIDAAKADAKGTVDLPNQQFDYNLGLTLTDDLFNQSCGINPALKGVRVPVNCAGAFDGDPAELCSVDPRFIEDIIKNAIGERVQQELDQKRQELEQQAKEKVQEQIGDKIESEAGNLIRGIFGR